MPKVLIEASIARGQGTSLSGQPLEPLTIEAMFPGSVAVVIECLTDSKGRLLQDLRQAIKEHGGNVTSTAYLFQKRGKITFAKKDGVTPDDCLEHAIESGAMDITSDEDGRLVIYTEPSETKAVAETFGRVTNLMVERSEIIWDPNKDTTVTPEAGMVENLEDALSVIRDDSGVRDVFINTVRSFDGRPYATT
jgi:transcriptional/translational regulatory protein YebC/TACO1